MISLFILCLSCASESPRLKTVSVEIVDVGAKKDRLTLKGIDLFGTNKWSTEKRIPDRIGFRITLGLINPDTVSRFFMVRNGFPDEDTNFAMKFIYEKDTLVLRMLNYSDSDSVALAPSKSREFLIQNETFDFKNLIGEKSNYEKEMLKLLSTMKLYHNPNLDTFAGRSLSVEDLDIYNPVAQGGEIKVAVY